MAACACVYGSAALMYTHAHTYAPGRQYSHLTAGTMYTHMSHVSQEC